MSNERGRRLLLVAAATMFCAGAYSRAKESQKPDGRGDVLIEGIAHVRQRTDFCGEACAEMYLRKLGKNIDQDDVFNESGVDPVPGRGKFYKLWPLKYDKKRWTLIRIRLEAGRIKEPRRVGGFSNADYAQHIMELKKKIPNKSFTVVLQRPFVIIGDESPAMVRRRATETVKWAVDKLKQDYFERAPLRIIDIWLFKDEASYRKHTWRIFRDRPDTPFGYYSHEHNCLIMNIATGGGTLVHEIVHPFMSSNFPACPAWFNEGLASLYEQCGQKGGHISGLTNWRLAGLQRDIRGGTVASFRSLTHTTEQRFYGCADGDNYAQARYLCYYMQEKGLLGKFYHEFRANHTADATGFETLKKVLGELDMRAFQQRWERFVLGLRFP